MYDEALTRQRSAVDAAKRPHGEKPVVLDIGDDQTDLVKMTVNEHQGGVFLAAS